MAQAATSSAKSLRPSAAVFQPEIESSSAMSINNSDEVIAQTSHPESTASNKNKPPAGAPTEPAAMRQRRGLSGVRLQNDYAVARSGGESQINNNDHPKAQYQLRGRYAVTLHSRTAPSSSSHSITPKGHSYAQSIAYHCPKNQFSTAEAGHPEADNNMAAVVSENKPASHMSMAEVARSHVSCKDNACECHAVVNDLLDRLMISEMELETYKLTEPQSLEKFRSAAAAVEQVAILERRLANMGEDKLLLEQRLRELEQTEEEKEAEVEVERNKTIADFKKQFASQAPAVAQDENQAGSSSPTASKAQEPATAQADNQQNNKSSTSGNISEEAPVQLWRIRKQKTDSTSTAASKQPTPPTTPEEIKFNFMAGGWETRIRAERKKKTNLAKEKRARKDRGEELYPGQLWIDQQRRSTRIAQEIESGERYDQASDSESELSGEEICTDSDDDETGHVCETPAMPGKGYAKYGPGGEFGKRGGGGDGGAGWGRRFLFEYDFVM
ncbi:hypothetical protein IFR05_005234 [Cadophora sp. M221]|nr:hypothetical protein IFR05_005234 [Cadophora sp. M221]